MEMCVDSSYHNNGHCTRGRLAVNVAVVKNDVFWDTTTICGSCNRHENVKPYTSVVSTHYHGYETGYLPMGVRRTAVISKYVKNEDSPQLLRTAEH
jgi:hypothetical protein